MQTDPLTRTPQYSDWWWRLRIALLARGWTWQDAKSVARADAAPYFLAGDSPEMAAWRLVRCAEPV